MSKHVDYLTAGEMGGAGPLVKLERANPAPKVRSLGSTSGIPEEAAEKLFEGARSLPQGAIIFSMA
jgi:hypothetical protein